MRELTTLQCVVFLSMHGAKLKISQLVRDRYCIALIFIELLLQERLFGMHAEATTDIFIFIKTTISRTRVGE